MVNVVQESFVPDYVPHPGETLSELLDEFGMSQVQLAERTGRSEKLISQIVNSDAGISPELALQLERTLSVPAHFWLNLERQYREFAARASDKLELQDQIQWLNSIPTREMIKWRYMRRCSDKLDQLLETLRFFGISHPTQWPNVWERQVAQFRIDPKRQPDELALAAWLRQGELLARNIDSEPFDQKKFARLVPELRALTTEKPSNFIHALQELCAGAGVAVVFVPELRKTYVSGVTRWITPDKALIQLSLRYKSDDMLWFAFFHECYHVLNPRKRKIFLRTQDQVEDVEERKANKFAAETLVPARKLTQLMCEEGLKGTYGYSKSAIQMFAESIGVSPGIVVGRLQHEGSIPHANLNGLKKKYEWVSPA